jgi:gas vesicle protein GvpN
MPRPFRVRCNLPNILGGEMMVNSKDSDVKYEGNFIETEYTNKISRRALSYLNSGFPIHLRGPAGVGKTSLAFYIAKKIGRPVIFMCGSEEFSESDMIGHFNGVESSVVIDNYIRTVYERQEQQRKTWLDGKLVTACKNGYTVIYDEFTRTRPEVNNILLSVLEEKIISMPGGSSKESYIKIHPEFNMIFTSNPEEYVGVYKSANALIDRMITIDINASDEETEKMIVMSKSGLSPEDAERLVKISSGIRSLVNDNKLVSIRSSIMLANIVSRQNIKIEQDSQELRQICMDIFRQALLEAASDVGRKDSLSMILERVIISAFSDTSGSSKTEFIEERKLNGDNGVHWEGKKLLKGSVRTAVQSPNRGKGRK